jgi:DUF3047 family protein
MRLKHTKHLKTAKVFLITLMVLFLSIVFAQASGAQDRITVPIARSSSGAPDGWDIKEWKGTASFEVVDTKEAGMTIHMKSSSTSSALYRDVKFELKDYPYISWKWKVVKVPEGADVRKKSTDDQAAQVYVIFPRFPAAVNSRLVGYIWDTGAPQGSVVTSTKTSNTRYIVLKSDSVGLGQWFTEKRNVYEDYRKLFNEEPPAVGKVSVMIDSDDTKSAAESYVGDIYFSRE